MTSIIVLDSSDDDEKKLKRAKVVQTNPRVKSVNSPTFDGFVTTISTHPKHRFLPTNATVTSHNGSIIRNFTEPPQHNNELETNKQRAQSGTHQNERNLGALSEKSTFSKPRKHSQLKIVRTPTPISEVMSTSPNHHPSYYLQFVSPTTAAGQVCSSTENEKVTVRKCSPLLTHMSGSVYPIVEAGKQPPLKLMATPPYNPMAKLSNGEDETEYHHPASQPVLSFVNDNQCSSTANFSERQFINVDNSKVDAPQTVKQLQSVSVISTTSSTAMNTNTTFFSKASVSKPIRRVKPISIEKRNVDADSPVPTETTKSNQTHVINDVKLQSFTLANNPLKKGISNQAKPDIETNSASDLIDHELNAERKTKSISFNSKKQKLSESFKKRKCKTYPNGECQLECNYRELIHVCRQIDSSPDMEKLIKRKLIKYYFEVHPDFVKSKSFIRNIRRVIENIRSEPDLIYYNLKTVVEELKIRRNTQTKAATDIQSDTQSALEQNSSSGVVDNHSDDNSHTNRKTEAQIRKLNKALYILTKRIDILERTEVDWDNEDSSYLRVERYKKRACQIYEKICDLTGESKNAHRLVKKPIKFNETPIPEFNKTLQTFINRTREFPDYFDVLRMMEHCNRTYSLGLLHNQINNIAEEAFIKVGKLLQSRRRTELYETLNYFAGSYTDPAADDPQLAAKLSENQQKQKKINDIIEKFVLKQEMPKNENLSNSTTNLETSNDNKLSCPTTLVADADEQKPSTSVLEISSSSSSSSACEIPFKIAPVTKTLTTNFVTCNKPMKELVTKVNLETSGNIDCTQASASSIDAKGSVTSKQKQLEPNKIIVKSHMKFAKNQIDEVAHRPAKILTYETGVAVGSMDCIDKITSNNKAPGLGNMEMSMVTNASTTRKQNCNLYFQPQQKQHLSQTPNSINSTFNNQSQIISNPTSSVIHPTQRIIFNGKIIKNYIHQNNFRRNNNMNETHPTQTQNNSSTKLLQQNNKTNNSNNEINTMRVKATYCPEIFQASVGKTPATTANELIENGRGKNAFTQKHLKLSHAIRIPTTTGTINNRTTDLKIVSVSSLNPKLSSEAIVKNFPPILKNKVNIFSNNLYKDKNKKTFDDIIISDDDL